jgi:hypothetical protein
MAGLVGNVYRSLFKRTSTFAATILLGAFFFERTFDVTSEYIFESINRGVRFALLCLKREVIGFFGLHARFLFAEIVEAHQTQL